MVAELNMCLVAVHPIKAPRAAGPPQRLSLAPSYLCALASVTGAELFVPFPYDYMDDTGSAQYSF